MYYGQILCLKSIWISYNLLTLLSKCLIEGECYLHFQNRSLRFFCFPMKHRKINIWMKRSNKREIDKEYNCISIHEITCADYTNCISEIFKVNTQFNPKSYRKHTMIKIYILWAMSDLSHQSDTRCNANILKSSIGNCLYDKR